VVTYWALNIPYNLRNATLSKKNSDSWSAFTAKKNFTVLPTEDVQNSNRLTQVDKPEKY